VAQTFPYPITIGIADGPIAYMEVGAWRTTAPYPEGYWSDHYTPYQFWRNFHVEGIAKYWYDHTDDPKHPFNQAHAGVA
jgi:hypothetical protein